MLLPVPLERAVVAVDRVYVRFHRWLYLTSRGWLGHRLAPPARTLMLITTGRRTGLRRAATVSYAWDGGTPVLVASNYGGAHPPAWLLNLQEHPVAEVWLGRRRHRVIASIIQPGDSAYDRLWQLANDNNRNRYETYRARTTRPIPVVRLEISQ